MDIPIIDPHELGAEKALHKAFTEVGFCYIKTDINPNHFKTKKGPISIFEYAKKFFDLPLEEKNKVKYDSTESNVGYQGMIESLTPGTPVDLKEAFNWCEYKNDFFNKWYDKEQEFVCQSWSYQVKKVANTVMILIEQALGLEPFTLLKKHYWSESTTSRILHYPKWDGDIQENQNRGGEHTDYGTITVLFTDGTGGLQVKPKGSDYIDAPHIAGTAIINVGDLLERWTNDLYTSTPHRVINTNLDVSRYSLPYFVHPVDDVMVDSLIGQPKYDPITAKDYLVWRLNQSY